MVIRPKNIIVARNSDVKIKLVNNDGSGCAQALQFLPWVCKKWCPLAQRSLVSIPPDKQTQIAFMCSMGMYRGVINVN